MSHLPNICPDPSRWLAVAGGAESPEMSAQLTEHAANCAACAGQLREAIRIMADDADPEEERFLAMLKSSQPAWQKQMARELAASPAFEEPRPSRTTWWNWRLAGALAAAVVVIGVVSLVIVEPNRHSGQSGEQGQVGTPPASTKSSPEAVAVQKGLLALVLDPEASRGVQPPPERELTAEIQTVEVTLNFLEPPPPRFSLKVQDFGGRVIWTKEVTMTDQEIKNEKLIVNLPANLFPAGDYRILAEHVTDKETQNVSNYAFRVKR